MKNISKNLLKTKSIIYLIILVVFIGSNVIFLGSGSLFSNTNKVTATKLYEEKSTDNIKFNIIQEQYNPDNNLLVIIFNTEYKNEKIDNNLNFHIKTLDNTSRKANWKTIRINNDYVVLLVDTKSKKWETFSLTVNELDKNNNTTSKSEKVLVTKESVTLTNDLIELNADEYYKQIIDINIEQETNNISEFNNQIEELNTNISNLKSQINDYESKKKFATEKEITELESKINSKKNSIQTYQKTLENLEKQIDELTYKIEMLEEKKASI